MRRWRLAQRGAGYRIVRDEHFIQAHQKVYILRDDGRRLACGCIIGLRWTDGGTRVVGIPKR